MEVTKFLKERNMINPIKFGQCAVVQLSFLLGIILPTSAFSQKDVPDLNGSWKFNPSKSTWEGPGSFEWRIKQAGDRIVVEITGDRISNRLEYMADKKPRVAGVVPGQDGSDKKITTRAWWEGKELILISEFQDGALPELTSRFSLSPDGKVLFVRRVMGDMDRTLVFDKQ